MAKPKTRSPRNSSRSLSSFGFEPGRTLECVSANLSSSGALNAYLRRSAKTLASVVRRLATALVH